jgi:hypothetical protein
VTVPLREVLKLHDMRDSGPFLRGRLWRRVSSRSWRRSLALVAARAVGLVILVASVPVILIVAIHCATGPIGKRWASGVAR